MRCPSCGNEVPARPICLRCGMSLFGDPAAGLPASARGPIAVPLTVGQKARLLAGCLPFVTFVLVIGAYLVLARRGIVPGPPPLFYIFIGVVILLTGYYAIQNVRDLVSGVALVQEDLLHRSYRSRSGGGVGHYYGRFERLGTLRMIPKVHFRSSRGTRYRVVYSPASKLVWALEPPDPPIRS